MFVLIEVISCKRVHCYSSLPPFPSHSLSPSPPLSPSLSLSLPPFSLSQFDVHEKQEVVGKDQWKELEEEEEEEEVIEESDEETEGGFTETESD